MSDLNAGGIPAPPEVRLLDVDSAMIEVTLGSDPDGDAPWIAAAHPADAFGLAAHALLAEASLARVATVNPRGLGASTATPPAPDDASLETMVDDLEAARLALGICPWTFWGMSGGGFLALVYAHRYPEALTGLILDSTCACFPARLADPACIASPFHPLWREPLSSAGLAGGAVDPGAGTSGGEWIGLAGGAEAYVLDGRAVIVSPLAASPAMRRAMPAMLAYDARPWLASITVPALVLCGAADPFVPLSHARAVHEGIAGSRFVAIAGAGHVPVTARHPEALEAVRRFLGTAPEAG